MPDRQKLINLNLPPALIATIDAARGDVPRQTYLRKRLQELFAQPPSVPTCQHCGRALDLYEYGHAFSDRPANAWLAKYPRDYRDGSVYAYTWEDVILWLNQQPTIHDVRNAAGELLATGQGPAGRRPTPCP